MQGIGAGQITEAYAGGIAFFVVAICGQLVCRLPILITLFIYLIPLSSVFYNHRIY